MFNHKNFIFLIKSDAEQPKKIYHQALRHGRRQSLVSLPWAWSARPGLCPTRLGWRTAGTERSPVDIDIEAMVQSNKSNSCEAKLTHAHQRKSVHLGVVHDNGFPRWKLQPTVPLVGGHSLLILGLNSAKEDCRV